MSTTDTLEGGCTCGAVRFRLASAPMYVHCCHCRWCQRETGASFALNASKQPWVVLPPGTPAVAEYYKSAEHWPAASLERRAALFGKAR